MEEGGSKNMTAANMIKLDVKEARDEAEAERREKMTSTLEKTLQKSAQATVKVGAERAKIEMKNEMKREVETEEAMKRPLLWKINKYVEAFPWLMQKIPKLTAKSTLPELEMTLGLIREELSSQRSLVNVHRFLDQGVMVMESVWGDGSNMTFVPPQYRLNLTGMTALWRKGQFMEEWEPLIQEIDIEYPWLGRQSLPFRAMEALISMLVTVHVINVNPQARAMFKLDKEKPVVISE